MVYLLSMANVALAEGQPQVIVVGAGMSGMSTAATLEKRGVGFLVLEARNYTGGRMHAIPFGDPSVGQRMVEVGANWVQGGPPNVVHQMATKLGLRVNFEPNGDSPSNYDEAYDRQGRRVEHMNRTTFLEGQVDACLELQALALAAQIKSSDQTVREGLSKCGWTVDKSASSVDVAIDFLYYQAEYAISAERTSLRHNVPDPQYEWNEPDDYFIVDQNARGYALVADALTTISSADPRVVLNAEVASISSTSDRVVVTLSNGTELAAAAAVVTVPIGVLNAKDGIRFDPPLPQVQARALSKYTMANFSKLHMQWRETFWNRDVRRWLMAADLPSWVNLDHDSMLPGSHMLMAWTAGPQAARLEAMNDAEVRQEAMALLKMIYPEAPEPIAFHFTRHSADKHQMRACHHAGASETRPIHGVMLHARQPPVAAWRILRLGTGHDDRRVGASARTADKRARLFRGRGLVPHGKTVHAGRLPFRHPGRRQMGASCTGDGSGARVAMRSRRPRLLPGLHHRTSVCSP